MCMWVEMDVLWRRCSVICRMHVHSTSLPRSGKGGSVTPGDIKGAEVVLSNSRSLNETSSM